MRPTAV